MSNVTTTARPQATIKESTNPTVYNIPCAVAGTEYFHDFSASPARKFIIKARGTSKVQLAFVNGDTGTIYYTINRGAPVPFDGLNFNGIIYFSCDQNNEVIEIVKWN